MAAFVAAFLVFLAVNDILDVQVFYWDAESYWELSRVRALLHFPAIIRGYFYPLLLAPSRLLCDLFPNWGYGPFRLVSSAIYAYVLTHLLPDFYQTVFGGRINIGRRLVAPVLLAIIYPGLIVTTLSDLPAVCLMLGAIVCGLHSVAYADRGAMRYSLLLLSGVLAYGAYNTRTIFLFPAALLLLAVPLVLYRGRKGKLRSTALLIMVAGVIIAGIPQLLINVKNHGIWSPAVVTTADDKSLFARQLIWGMSFQRYETTIDPTVPGPEVYYPDPAGQELLDSLKLDTASFTVADYLGLLVRHPLSFIGIYGRHLVNGLDVRDGEAYTRSQSTSKDGFAFFNFLIVFLGASLMLAAAFRHMPIDRSNGVRWFWALVALLPVLMIIPGAIETRFFLTLHLAFYSAIAFNCGAAGVAMAVKKYWLPIVLVFGMTAGIFFSITLTAMTGVEYGPDRVHVTSGLDTTHSVPAG